MEIGGRVSWRTANGFASGTITEEHPLGWKVRLDNGKYMIVWDEERVHKDPPDSP
jgi:hypothetical protein